ncbi:hypothetical protein [Chryseobacterium lathyri]|uniref:hypothetical protein n=1 Tax=Chryseobacterium lathyri TaxID=395933 RepID=UPI001CBEB19A|nr:hypothetical protein [Chryseobacterium lathyri]
MKTNKKAIAGINKGLPKLTESENKINSLLSLEKITREDLKILNAKEREDLTLILTRQFNTLTGEDKDKFCTQVEEIMDQGTRNEIWEHNHINIMWAITSHIKENGRMPTKTEIASKTELSRQTIHKHLANYKNSPYYAEFQQQFHIMQSKVMTTVFQYAINGDMKAAKLYLECIGTLKNTSFGNNPNHINNNTLIQNQNNYIQINGKVLSQETVKNLNPDQLNTIEGILKTIEGKDIEKKN